MNKITLIDGNNEFHRQLNTDPDGNPVRTIYKYTQLLSQTSYVIWVFDGVNSNQRRRDIFPAYKMNREPSGQDFKKALDLTKAILKLCKCFIVEVPGFEADDVIAQIAEDNPGSDVHIRSNDADLLQIQGVTMDRRNCNPWTKCDLEYIRLYKTLVGDPSDAIPGIPGFGPKAFEKCNKDVFIEFLDDHIIAFENLDLSPKHEEWVAFNWHTLLDYWEIVGFFPIPNEEIQSNIFIGKARPEEVEAILQKHLM